MSIEDHDLHDDLERVAEGRHQTAELIHASDGWWAADDGVDAVHLIVRSSAHASRALAGWYDRCRQRIFDERLGAEEDATKAVTAAERALRAFAAELEALADRHGELVGEVDHLRHRDLISLAVDELGESGQAYAVREITGLTAVHVSLGLYERADVARRGPRAGTRWLCRHAVPRRRGHVRHARQTRRAVGGGARRRAVRTLAHATVENSLSRFGVRVRLRDMRRDSDDVRALPVPAWLEAHSEPNIEAIVAMLGPEMQQRYRRCLAEEVRVQRTAALPACLRALTQANREIEGLNRARHPDSWPR